MRVFKISAIIIALISISSIKAQEAFLISSKDEITNKISILLQDMSLAEYRLEHGIPDIPIPSSPAARKQRMREIYELKVDFAAAEQNYYSFIKGYAPDEPTRTKWNRLEYSAKRRKDTYQAKVYQCTSANHPAIR